MGHFPTGTSNYNLSAGTLNVNGGLALSTATDGTGNFTQTGGVANATQVDVNSRNATTGNGTFKVNGGIFNVGSGGIVTDGGGGPYFVEVGGSGGTLRATAPWTSLLNISLLGSGLNAATIDTNGFNVSLSGILGGSGGLNKVGAGVLTLTGNNTHTGNTDISGGTLLLNGSHVASTLRADYRDNYQGGSFPAGWQYLWNANGDISNPANYIPFLAAPNGTYDIDGVNGLPGSDPGAFAFLNNTGGHPGRSNGYARPLSDCCVYDFDGGQLHSD
jgi:autotransporter-associated beta strand protein